MSRVKLGQGCDARFFGLPEQLFPGKVRAIAPVLSKERRSLRVLFAISDPHDQLRPGMFADIGLGTDARIALLVPPEAIVHVGRSDYVLLRGGNDGLAGNRSASRRTSRDHRWKFSAVYRPGTRSRAAA